ncbi:nuclear transport factor 2 family protein [Kribbella sp. DT2]|uniref:nuclear transport factor 2 family protein n=1 Tax=Kribbella sp. DT2 TaxID=3393427 RepID=UPI003CECEA73
MTTLSVVQDFLTRLAAQDADAVGELFADDIDWQVPGNPSLPWTGAREHGSDVPVFLRTMWSHFVEGRSEVRLDDIAVDGETAVVFAQLTHTAAPTGRPFTTAAALRFRVVDGQIVKLHLYEDTHAVSAAFV